MGTYKISPVDLQVDDIIKGVGEVTRIINVARFYTIVNVFDFDKGKERHVTFENGKEIEVLRG